MEDMNISEAPATTPKAPEKAKGVSVQSIVLLVFLVAVVIFSFTVPVIDSKSGRFKQTIWDMLVGNRGTLNK